MSERTKALVLAIAVTQVFVVVVAFPFWPHSILGWLLLLSLGPLAYLLLEYVGAKTIDLGYRFSSEPVFSSRRLLVLVGVVIGATLLAVLVAGLIFG